MLPPMGHIGQVPGYRTYVQYHATVKQNVCHATAVDVCGYLLDSGKTKFLANGKKIPLPHETGAVPHTLLEYVLYSWQTLLPNMTLYYVPILCRRTKGEVFSVLLSGAR